jgi:hypothetical protein
MTMTLFPRTSTGARALPLGTIPTERQELFAGCMAGYAAGRLGVEALRTDPATELLGVRVNLWVSATTLLTATAVTVSPTRATGTPATPNRSWAS